MRLATLRTSTGTVAARIEGDEAIELAAADVGALLADSGWRDSALVDGERRRYTDSDFAPLIPRPPKVLCLGHNYLAHIREQGFDPPSHPTLFAKFARALIGPRDDIVLPRVSDQVDYEVELAIVIGQNVRHAEADEASAAIAGYTVLNDVSVRDWQWRTAQWLQGKTFERTTPVGPVLVTADEVDATDLALRTEINGEVLQDSRTADMVFKPAEVVAYISQVLTLEPGDLIATGTPEGVGAARTPPRFLRPGDTLHTSIEGIGRLVNRCVAE